MGKDRKGLERKGKDRTGKHEEEERDGLYGLYMIGRIIAIDRIDRKGKLE